MNATRAYCLSKRKATEDSPGGWSATCMRLNNKIFAIVNHEEGEKVCDYIEVRSRSRIKNKRRLSRNNYSRVSYE